MPATALTDDVLRATTDRIAAQRRLPESTYRVQFQAGFRFADATRIVPYLHDLGITHLYASPILKARPGSTHGYDQIDPRVLNPELGTADDFAALTRALHERGMGLLLDTVPNHMGVGTNDNPWWNDVLENGSAAAHGDWFDIAWRNAPRPELHDKVLLPVLGEPYGNVLESGQLKLALDDAGGLSVSYYDRRFPIALRTYGLVLYHGSPELRNTLTSDAETLRAYQQLANEVDPTELKRQLSTLLGRSEALRRFVQANIEQFNGAAGDPRSFDKLDELLNAQFYRLAYWRTAADEINYRRFFDINDLAALATERQPVFDAVHALPMRMLVDGTLSGLRIDHPDGLYDPRQYFLRLQRGFLLAMARSVVESDPRFKGVRWVQIEPDLAARLESEEALEAVAGDEQWPLYVVAEKILGPDEPLPDDWAVEGTSGYDFLVLLNGLFIDAGAASAFTQRYNDWIGDATSFEEIVYRKKCLILGISLASELNMLAHQLDRIAQRDRRSRDFTLNGLRHALREVIAAFPVYRSYIDESGVHESDARDVERAVDAAVERNPKVDPAVFHFVRDALLQRAPDTFTQTDRAALLRFAGKFQQLTAPTTAKGIEDTAFYVYNRFVSLNEVGGDPGRFGIAPEAFHRYLLDRQQRWPYALSSLSTHDTKRSEDVRARLNVLSEMPEEWWQRVTRWSRFNEPHRRAVDGVPAPDPNDEYLLYQAILGAWPLEPFDAAAHATFVQRIQAYMEKAMREAKVHTSWTSPNADYESAVRNFIARILDDSTASLFLQDFRAFERLTAQFGVFNALSQTVLRLAAPGVPDTYQGTALWDFSLVDPDNRRPVDYGRRQQMLNALQARAAKGDLTTLTRELLTTKEDGRLKLYVTWQGLTCRRENPGLFSTSDYIPLEATGSRRDHVFAFLRRLGDRWALVAVPRLISSLVPAAGDPPMGGDVWHDTRLTLPAEAAGIRFRDRFTGVAIKAGSGPDKASTISTADLFASFPLALCVAH